MRQNLGQLIDGCMVRISNHHVIGEQGFVIEVNHACEELYSRIRDQRATWLQAQDFADVVTGQDIVDLPNNCGGLLMVEQNVSGGFQLLQRMGLHEVNNWARIERTNLNTPEVYAHLPDRRILLRPKPTESRSNGLRFTYSRRFVPLEHLEDVPDVPEELHEWIISAAVDRLRQYADVILGKPDDFERFRREQDLRLVRYLSPTNIDQPARIGDEDPFYLSY